MNWKLALKMNEIEQKADAIAARATLAGGEMVASYAKQSVHRLTGTLSRSIHVEQVGYTGAGDLMSAQGTPGGGVGVSFTSESVGLPTVNGGKAAVWVGSWIPYAIYEEVLHPYLAPAVAQAQARFPEIVAKAAAEAGFRVR